MRYTTILLLVSVLLTGCTKNETTTDEHATAGHHDDADGQGDAEAHGDAGMSHDHGELGSVDFVNSCDAGIADDINQGVALIHNMTYNGARNKFLEIIESNPDCGIAQWGVGMTYIHPLWSDSPNEESMADGLQRVVNARATDLDVRETAFVDALAAYYENAEIPLYDRLKLMAAGFAAIYEQYPEDLEVKAFYAVTHLSTMTPGKVDTEIIESAADIDRFVDGAVLVTVNTDPDWVPIMKRAAAIVADHGGRTSHAAIVSRELGVPAIVGTGNATQVLHDHQMITVSCAEGEEGIIYAGKAEITVTETNMDTVPETHTKIMLNLANPSAAMRWWRLPADGVG